MLAVNIYWFMCIPKKCIISRGVFLCWSQLIIGKLSYLLMQMWCWTNISCSDAKLPWLLLSHTMHSSSVPGFTLSVCYQEDFLVHSIYASWLPGWLAALVTMVTVSPRMLERPSLARLIVSNWSMSAKLAVQLWHWQWPVGWIFKCPHWLT